MLSTWLIHRQIKPGLYPQGTYDLAKQKQKQKNSYTTIAVENNINNNSC